VREKQLTLVGHLGELRKRLTIIAVAFIVTSGASYTYIQLIIDDILKPGSKLSFIYVAPAELLIAYIKLSMIAGVTLASPIIFWQIWAFVKPGLKKGEKRAIIASLLGGTVFFIMGVVFAYKIILPFMLEFFYNLRTDDINPMISIGSYVGFITTILLSFGLIFEMPIVIILLTRLGIIEPKFLKKNRKYIILLVFVVAAIITPPDVISQILLAGPMLLLFEFGVIVSTLTFKKKVKEA
jgi:sec-independent protein translocase protein TatC